jgi:hypothetical protein
MQEPCEHSKTEPTIGSLEHVLGVCDNALALAGYKILDGDRYCIFIKYKDSYFEVKIAETFL